MRCQKHPESWIGLNGPGYCQACAREREALGPSDATACSPDSLFDVDMLKRAIMDEDAAEKFRGESKQILIRDLETQAVAECYRHPDGRVLIAAIRLPENAAPSRPEHQKGSEL